MAYKVFLSRNAADALRFKWIAANCSAFGSEALMSDERGDEAHAGFWF